MNSRKAKSGPRGGPAGGSGPTTQSYGNSGHRSHSDRSYANKGPRSVSDKNSASPVIHNDNNVDNKPAVAASGDQVLQQHASAVEGVYQNGRIMHTITSLIGSVVQVVVRDGQTYEGVLQTFSPEFEIALATVTEIDKRSASEGNNIGHLISSLCNNQSMDQVRLFPIKDVVTISCFNTDMDFASTGGFQTDSELSAKNKVDTSSEERTLVPWAADDAPDEQVRKSVRAVDLDGDNSNGWTAEDMFAVNSGLGVQSGFEDLDGVYTIPLTISDTPEGREKQKQAEAIAREIENNQQSKRRTDQENSDDRTEEEQFSAVTRNAETFRHPKAHPNLPGNRSDEMNWRQQSNRSQQNAHSKSAAYAAGGKNSSPSSNQQQQQQVSGGSSGGRDGRQNYPPGPRGRHQMQNQIPIQQQQQQQQQTPPHHPPHQHHPQPQGNINAAPAPHPAPQRQQAPNAVPAPAVQSPKSDVPSKSISSSAAPPTAPNYAKVVADDSSSSRNAKSSKKKEDTVPADQSAAKPAPVVSTSAASSPVTEKKEIPVIIKEKGSPSDPPADKRDETAKHDAESVESIAKNSKLNPNAKEFTLNPAAKPFTPRSQQPLAQPQQQPQQQQHQQQHHSSSNMPAQYSNQPQNVVAPVHHMPHQHFQQQNPAPQMVQIQPQGVPRMQNQQVHLLHQMVPGGNVFPYQVVMPQYQQQMPMNQPRPGKQSSKYQNPGNRNDQYNQNSPHNVAAATGHPVLATAPITYPQQPGLAQLFQPMYQMQGFNPRMQGIGMMGHQVQYDPHMYLSPVQMPLVQQMSQQNNGHHSNPSTPQSQTPTTPGLHGGPPTPGPTGHPHQGQTPTPQQTVMYSTGQNLPPHSIAGGFNSQNMVLMGPQHQQQSHAGVGGQNHAMGPVIPVLQSSATPIVMQQHYQQNQPPPGR